MFTGIIETVGTLLATHPGHWAIHTPLPFDDLALGDSVAVNGVCLTVTEAHPQQFTVTVVPETLRCTTFSTAAPGQKVNLERPLTLVRRMGGHYVQGHVDAASEILDLQPDGKSALIATIRMPKELSRYIVNKGYIAIDGMSITVIEAQGHQFTVTFVPHTQKATIVQDYQVGTPVNLEVDILSKYIEKYMGGQHHAILS